MGEKKYFCNVVEKNPKLSNKLKYYITLILCKVITILYMLYIIFRLKIDKIDVYIGFSHSYMPIFFIGKNIKKTVFLYDMVWKILPETMAPSNRIKMQLLSSYNLKRTDFLISISDNTKQDFLKFFNYKKNIYTIHLAVDKKTYHLASPDNITIVKDKFNLPDSYVLAVGTIEPRKNLITLLKAFSILNNKNIHLVLVGKIGWIDNNFFELLDQYKIKNRVVFTGYVSDKFLAPLYSGAKMFVFPSIYEGFGLPILEAMQCGCPVIASNNSSIPEVAGDAALLFDANDYTELARLIDKLLQDENLRKSYIAKGFEQVKKFSWEKTVAQLLNVIESEYNNTNFKK